MNKSVTVCANFETPHTVGHHQLGGASSRNMAKDIQGGTESSPFRSASACATSEASLSLGHHPLGRASSRNRDRNIKGGIESSHFRCAASRVEHNTQKTYKLLSGSQETEAVEICSPDIHKNESSGEPMT